MKRFRAVTAAVVLVGGLFATATAAQAGACVDAYLEVNGDVVADETHCVG